MNCVNLCLQNRIQMYPKVFDRLCRKLHFSITIRRCKQNFVFRKWLGHLVENNGNLTYIFLIQKPLYCDSNGSVVCLFEYIRLRTLHTYFVYHGDLIQWHMYASHGTLNIKELFETSRPWTIHYESCVVNIVPSYVNTTKQGSLSNAYHDISEITSCKWVCVFTTVHLIHSAHNTTIKCMRYVYLNLKFKIGHCPL